jgi:hypothetical protein
VLRNEARRVVSQRATCRNRSTLGESTCRFDQSFATIHNVREWVLVFLRRRVQLDPHGIGIDIIKKNLSVK